MPKLSIVKNIICIFQLDCAPKYQDHIGPSILKDETQELI